MKKNQGERNANPAPPALKEPEPSSAHVSPAAIVAAGVIMGLFLILWALGWPARGEGIDWYRDGGYRFALISDITGNVILPLFHLLFMALASTCGGVLLLRIIRAQADSPLERLLYGAAAGMGFLSIAVMILGCLAFPSIWLIEIAMIIAGARSTLAEVSSLAEARIKTLSNGGGAERASKPLLAVFLAGGLFLALGWAAAYTPPFEYDALEYHLGLPARYALEGRIRHIPENVFANFPQNAEMIFYAAMLQSDIDSGARIGSLAMLYLSTLAATALGLACWRATGRAAGAWGGVFWLACPTVCASIATHSDSIVIACFGTLAMTSALALLATGPKEQAQQPGREGRYARLCGLMCGLAMGAKYPALLSVAAPAAIIFLCALLLRRGKEGVTLAGSLIPLGGWALCAAAALLPWLVKNTVFTGNPVYPFLYDIFGGRGWSASQAARFAAAHIWKEFAPASAPARLLDFLLARDLADHHASPLAIAFIPLAVAMALRLPAEGRAESLRLARATLAGALAWFATCFALWFLFTHRIDRFLSWSLPALALASGIGFALWEGGAGRLAKPLLVSFLIACAAYENARLLVQTGSVEASFGFATTEETLSRLGILEYRQAMESLNQATGGQAKAMFLGEARTFHARFPVVAPTVFDRHPLDGVLAVAKSDPARAIGILRESGIEYVLINWAELARLEATYAIRTPEGANVPLLENLDPATLDPLPPMTREGMKLLAAFGQPAPRKGPGSTPLPAIEIYYITK